jgi:hypothetical protein
MKRPKIESGNVIVGELSTLVREGKPVKGFNSKT